MAADRQKTHSKPGEHPAAEPKEKRGEYLTSRQLAEVLQISEATVHRLRRGGRIPAVLLTDRLIRFNLRDVQRALRPHSVSPTPDGSDSEQQREPSPQLSFEDLLGDLAETETASEHE
ncbi:MAG: helix-turn-helix domain-containing protein [Blastocatellia bacterium]